MSNKSVVQKMKVKLREYKIQLIENISNYEHNSRTHSEDQIQETVNSINEFGYTNPILVDENNIIIAGHCRVMAAKICGMDEIPTIIIDGLTEAQKAALVIADNKLALNAGWDFGKLAQQITFLRENNYDTDLTGFKADEIKTFMPDEVPPFERDEDAVPDVPTDPITKLGDVWILGNHRLMCGDSTMIDDFERLMNGGKADFCFTSPPYSDQREYEDQINLDVEHIATFIRCSYEKCNLFAVNLGMSRRKNEIVTYWDSYITEARNCGMKLLSWNVWDKGEAGSIGNQTAMFAISHEFIFVFGNDKMELNRIVPNKSAGELANHSGQRQRDGSVKKQKDRIVSPHSQMKTIFQCTAQKARDEINHPARFPVELPENYILSCTDENDSVYDPFGGSGTTLIACEKTNRKCFTMELSPKYCDVIMKRWEKFTNKLAVLEVNNERV